MRYHGKYVMQGVIDLLSVVVLFSTSVETANKSKSY